MAGAAASPVGGEGYVGGAGGRVGRTTFGASAPAKDLYGHFAITAEAGVEAATARL